jgi:hypothetical protein
MVAAGLFVAVPTLRGNCENPFLLSEKNWMTLRLQPQD